MICRGNTATIRPSALLLLFYNFGVEPGMLDFVDRCFINPPSRRSTVTSVNWLGRGLM